jgi:branched-chain amino acid transport system substrate-binding protein
MKKYRGLKFALTFAAFVLQVASVSAFAAPASGTKEPITIGLLQDISGPTSVLGNQVARGFTFAVEKINAEGGMEGHPIKLITYDYKGNIQEAVNAYNRMTTEGCSVVMGPPVSNVSAALTPITDEAKVPLLSLAGAPYLYKDTEGKPTKYTFLCQINLSDYGYTMASYGINELGFKKFGLLYDQTNAYCVSLIEPFKEYAAKHGAEIVAEEIFITGDLDFTPHLQKIMDAGPDAIFIPTYTQQNVIAAQNIAQMKLDIPVLGTLDHCYPFNKVLNNPTAANNIYMADNISYKDPALETLRVPYVQATGEEPTNKCYLGWDAAHIIKEAVRITGKIDTESIVAGLEKVKDLQLTTGSFSIDPATHMPVNPPMVIMKLEKGEYVELGSYKYK